MPSEELLTKTIWKQGQKLEQEHIAKKLTKAHHHGALLGVITSSSLNPAVVDLEEAVLATPDTFSPPAATSFTCGLGMRFSLTRALNHAGGATRLGEGDSGFLSA